MFMEGREAAQLGFCGEPWRWWAAWEGGGWRGDQLSNQETVSHCSLTPLALGGKDHEVLDIHQPAEEGRLPGARVCFPPPPRHFFPLSLAASMGSSATEPGQPSQAGRPGSLQIIRPLTPRLVTGRGEGGQGIPEDIRDRGQAVGLTAEVKRSSHGHASRSIAQLMLL